MCVEWVKIVIQSWHWKAMCKDREYETDQKKRWLDVVMIDCADMVLTYTTPFIMPKTEMPGEDP